jgi:hypothetical protein
MATKKKTATPQPQCTVHLWWAVPLLAILVYLPAFNADFTLDDVLIVEENAYVKSLDKIPSIWTSHYWAGKVDASDDGLYRPLTLTSYTLQYALFGEKPFAFHLINVLLHALVCVVLMKFVQLLFKDPWLVLLSGIIFAVHPLHAEAVAGIVGRAELLAALFILLSGISYHHFRKTGSMKWMGVLLLTTFAAITSKEHGFMIGPILFLQELYYANTWKNFTWSEKNKWIAFGGVALLSIILWSYRASITGDPVPHELWAEADASTRMATAMRISMEYVWMHVFPWTLSADYWTGSTPITGWGSPMVLISFVAMIGLIAVMVMWRKKQPVIAWGIAFFLLTLLPVSNFLFAAGFLKAERVVYIPSIGMIIALSAVLLMLRTAPKLKPAFMAVAALFVLFFAGRTYVRAMDWKNNFTLAQATLKSDPDSPRFNNMMGLELRAQQKNADALVYFEKSIQNNPSHVPALVNLGTEYRNMNRLPEAAATLEKALALDPNTLATYVNLMSVYRSMEDYDKNVEIAMKAVSRYPQSAAVLWNAANAFQLKGDMAKANELRAQAEVLDPKIGKGK